jgi:hypothetical protein
LSTEEVPNVVHGGRSRLWTTFVDQEPTKFVHRQLFGLAKRPIHLPAPFVAAVGVRRRRGAAGA